MADPFGTLTGDALVANSFKVTIDKQAITVKEVTGLKKEIDMIEIKTQNTMGQYVLRKIPGREKPVTVTITRPLTDEDTFEKWMELIKLGAVDRKDVIIDVLAPGKDTPVKTYTIKNCQPSAIEVTQVAAGATNPLDEKITLQGWEIKIESKKL